MRDSHGNLVRFERCEESRSGDTDWDEIVLSPTNQYRRVRSWIDQQPARDADSTVYLGISIHTPFLQYAKLETLSTHLASFRIILLTRTIFAVPTSIEFTPSLPSADCTQARATGHGI